MIICKFVIWANHWTKQVMGEVRIGLYGFQYKNSMKILKPAQSAENFDFSTNLPKKSKNFENRDFSKSCKNSSLRAAALMSTANHSWRSIFLHNDKMPIPKLAQNWKKSIFFTKLLKKFTDYENGDFLNACQIINFRVRPVLFLLNGRKMSEFA